MKARGELHVLVHMEGVQSWLPDYVVLFADRVYPLWVDQDALGKSYVSRVVP